MNRAAALTIWGLGTALLFCLLSIPQKIISGGDPWYAPSFLPPIIVGVLVGMFYGNARFNIKKLNKKLAQRVQDLEELLPICSACKKIRKADADPEQQNSWLMVEDYIFEKTGTSFSYGLCPKCLAEARSKLEKGDYL